MGGKPRFLSVGRLVSIARLIETRSRVKEEDDLVFPDSEVFADGCDPRLEALCQEIQRHGSLKAAR